MMPQDALEAQDLALEHSEGEVPPKNWGTAGDLKRMSAETCGLYGTKVGYIALYWVIWD